MTLIDIRGVSLFVQMMGSGTPLALMHGGPGADYTTLLHLRPLAQQFKLIFYDHRLNGRSQGGDITSFTWDNVVEDADALRQALGFERWAVLGHSFGGMVALEYALRHPDRISHLVLMDTCGDIRWAQEKGPQELARRGFKPETVALAQRFFNGQIAPKEMVPALMKFGGAYYHHLSPLQFVQMMLSGLRAKVRPAPLIFGYGQSLRSWNVMDRLHEITVPTLVIAGRQDFLFPPEHQAELAAGLPNARLKIIEAAGHNPHEEHPAEVIAAIRDLLGATSSGAAVPVTA